MRILKLQISLFSLVALAFLLLYSGSTTAFVRSGVWGASAFPAGYRDLSAGLMCVPRSPADAAVSRGRDQGMGWPRSRLFLLVQPPGPCTLPASLRLGARVPDCKASEWATNLSGEPQRPEVHPRGLPLSTPPEALSTLPRTHQQPISPPNLPWPLPWDGPTPRSLPPTPDPDIS